MARSKRSEGSAGVGGEAQAAPAGVSFEAALASLEGVVARLESGDLPLEQALEAFEEGVALSRRCAATLDAAERRIEILVAERVGQGARDRIEPFASDLETDDRSMVEGDGDPDDEP
jgi:exodeoxyribonuclease VII small subunit